MLPVKLAGGSSLGAPMFSRSTTAKKVLGLRLAFTLPEKGALAVRRSLLPGWRLSQVRPFHFNLAMRSLWSTIQIVGGQEYVFLRKLSEK